MLGIKGTRVAIIPGDHISICCWLIVGSISIANNRFESTAKVEIERRDSACVWERSQLAVFAQEQKCEE